MLEMRLDPVHFQAEVTEMPRDHPHTPRLERRHLTHDRVLACGLQPLLEFALWPLEHRGLGHARLRALEIRLREAEVNVGSPRVRQRPAQRQGREFGAHPPRRVLVKHAALVEATDLARGPGGVDIGAQRVDHPQRAGHVEGQQLGRQSFGQVVQVGIAGSHSSGGVDGLLPLREPDGGLGSIRRLSP